MPTYLDANGDPATQAAQPKQYLDPNTGEPIKASVAQTPQKGFWESLADSSGVTGAYQSAKQEIMNGVQHPIDTALDLMAGGPTARALGGLVQQVKDSGSQVGQAYQAAKQGNTAGAAYHAITAIPIVGPALDKASDQYADKNYAGEMGTLTGAAAQAAPIVAGGIDAAAPGRPTIPNPPVGDLIDATKMKLRPTSSPAIVPPETVQAQKIAQAILPPGGIKPALVQSIQAEAPAVVEYAQRTGNPLNTQAEGLAAAQGVAQEGLAHFNDNILKPVANQRVVLPSGTDLGASATLGQISDEISSLNKQVSTAKAANAGDALAAMAKKGDVLDQLANLRKALYENLSTKTGIPPDQLQALREGYGGQFTMADGLESAQNARLTRTGQAAQGQQTIAGQVPTSLADIPGKALTALKGGEQAIADRQFSSAMQGVKPQAPVRPLPTGVTTPPATGSALWAQQGGAKLIQAGLTQNDIDVLGRTGPGKQILVNASDLTPGSAAMKALVQQIKGANQ